MGPSLIILLIIVVWVIVLAPLVLGNNKPIRRSGEGYEETRVLHEGGSAPVAARRRPKLTAADVHRYGAEEEEYEVVEAVSDEERVLIDDTKGGLKPIFAKRAASAEVMAAQPVIIDAEEEPTEQEPAGEEQGELAEAAAEGGSTAYSVLQARGDAEDGDDAEGAEANVVVDEAYLDPSDFGYVDEAPAAENAGSAGGDADRGETMDPVEEDDDAELVEADAEPTDEDIAFAQTRRGRGGWDPQQDARNRANRYQRRQRTFAGLLVACVITLVAAAMFGGWVWVLPAISIGLTAWFLVALRRLVKKERALRQRRMRQLRRARLGVDTGDAGRAVQATHDEHVAPAVGAGERAPQRQRRRAGAIVVEMDDESPDFDHLPRYHQPEPEYSAGRPERAPAPQFGRAS